MASEEPSGLRASVAPSWWGWAVSRTVGTVLINPAAAGSVQTLGKDPTLPNVNARGSGQGLPAGR